MVFEIIMNNPGRYKYMSKSKDTVSVCLIDLAGGKKQTQNKQISHPLHLWQKKASMI